MDFMHSILQQQAGGKLTAHKGPLDGNALIARYCQLFRLNDCKLQGQCLQQIYDKLDMLVESIEREPYHLGAVLRMLATGLQPPAANDSNICLWICRILSKLIYRTSGKQEILFDAAQWFGEDGLTLLLGCLERFPGEEHSVYSVIEQICQRDMQRFMCQSLVDQLKDRQRYYQMVNGLIDYLCLSSKSRKVFEESRVLDNLMQQAFSNLDKPPSSVSDRIANFMFIANMMICFPRHDAELMASGIAALKKGSHDRSGEVRITCISCLFTILDSIIDSKTTIAMDIYKFIVFIVIEFNRDPIKSFLHRNLINFIEKHSRSPVNILVDPFIKALNLGSYDNLDFDLLIAVAKHGGLDPGHAMRLLEFLWRVATSDLALGRSALVALVIVIFRFQTIIQDQLVRLMQLTFKDFSNVVAPQSIESEVIHLSAEKELRLKLACETCANIHNLRLHALNSQLKLVLIGSGDGVQIDNPAYKALVELITSDSYK